MLTINKKTMSNSIRVILFSLFAVSVISCVSGEDRPTPTDELMQGVWEIDKVYNENDEDVTKKATSLFPAYIHLDDKNSINSTCGPLFMYLVYGESKFSQITGKIDEVFSYANSSLTEGEWFIKKGEVVDSFTCEMKMKFPTAETLGTILDLLGVENKFIKKVTGFVIYHKFMDVGVNIDDENPKTMEWILDREVRTEYNTKDSQGHKLLWGGVAVPFSKCRIILKKRQSTIRQLVEATK